MITEVTREYAPFATDGVSVDAAGVRHYEGLPATLIDLLRDRVAAHPDREAVVELGGERLTYQQLWDRAARVAGGLVAAGVERGDRVAVRYPPGLQWVLAFWGTIMAGGIVVAVNTRSAQPEVEFVLADSGARVDLDADSALPEGDPFVIDGLGARDVAAFFYTSGTTGKPKGVPTTHEAFIANCENMIRAIGLSRDLPELRTLISVPLFHVTGCNSQLLTVLHAGGSAVIMPALSVPGLVSALADEKISFLVTVPAVYSLVLRNPVFADADVSTVRWVGYGGAPIAPSLVLALQEAFPQAQVFNG